MKKLFLAPVLALTMLSATACEICGCGVGNFYLGMVPNFNSKFLGIRYQYMHYHTQLANDATQFSNDYYKTVEIWTGINLGKKWQALALIPYRINKQVSDDGINRQNGPGDISILLNYNLWHTRKSKGNNTVEQQLWIGGGIKLPTGKNNADVSSPNANPGDVNWQIGTGSTDFLINAIYDIRINRFGVNTSVNYKINTPNKNDYHYGNRITANTFAYYKTRAMGLGITPDAGLLFEEAGINRAGKLTIAETGGHILSIASGLEININKIAVGANVQLPLAQNFAEDQTRSTIRGMVHFTFAL